MTLFIIALFISALFIGIGVILNERNAKYLLSGYNTLSEEEQSRVDIKDYLKFFRSFHVSWVPAFLLEPCS